MEATQREKNIYGNGVEIVSREEDCTVYRLTDKNGGDIVMTCYKVFPGIELVYNDVHMQECHIEPVSCGNVIQIDHCREGRIECEFSDEYIYLTAGDLSIAYKNDVGHGSYFPLSHYHGVSIYIDIDEAPKCLSCFLVDVNVSPEALAQKFCSDNKGFVVRSNEHIDHVFSELYDVHDSIKKGYFKVKILELMLFLLGFDVKNKSEERFVSRAQVSLAKCVRRYLTDNMDKKLTLEQLSSQFHISGTQIKDAFKAVYGVSLYAFIRTQKMESAAQMLITTDKSVLEIAGLYGYDNGSKFASAFKTVIGMTPNEYRNHNL